MEVGQKVICINQRPWKNVETKKAELGPKYEDIVNISRRNPNRNDHLMFIEWGEHCSFDERHFVPLQDWQEATEFIESIKEDKEAEIILS